MQPEEGFVRELPVEPAAGLWEPAAAPAVLERFALALVQAEVSAVAAREQFVAALVPRAVQGQAAVQTASVQAAVGQSAEELSAVIGPDWAGNRPKY